MPPKRDYQRVTAPQLSEQLVADVVALHPVAAQVFVKHGMDCVGCAFARFETVREAAVTQGLDPELVTASLADAINATRRKRT
jgi:hybrid cluster-associated redox disulfide protein